MDKDFSPVTSNLKKYTTNSSTIILIIFLIFILLFLSFFGIKLLFSSTNLEIFSYQKNNLNSQNYFVKNISDRENKPLTSNNIIGGNKTSIIQNPFKYQNSKFKNNNEKVDVSQIVNPFMYKNKNITNKSNISNSIFDMEIKNGKIHYNLNNFYLTFNICNNGNMTLKELYNFKNKSEISNSNYYLNYYTENKILDSSLILTGLESPYDEISKLKNGACKNKAYSFSKKDLNILKNSTSFNIILDSKNNFINNDSNLKNNIFVLKGKKLNYYDLSVYSFGVDGEGFGNQIPNNSILEIGTGFKSEGFPKYFKNFSGFKLNISLYANDILVKSFKKNYFKDGYESIKFKWLVNSKKGPLKLRFEIKDQFEKDIDSSNNILNYNYLSVS